MRNTKNMPDFEDRKSSMFELLRIGLEKDDFDVLSY